jgi:homoserine dehydrogenase
MDVNLTDKKAELSDNGGYVHRFFVRTADSCENEARDIFGNSIDTLDAASNFGEFAFVTDLVSERDFREKYAQLSKGKGFIRVL